MCLVLRLPSNAAMIALRNRNETMEIPDPWEVVIILSGAGADGSM